ncbi:membrane protein [Mycobacterium phage Konstantine]|uniref:Uncharacterized protein n=1 Tax=Mycobacterium phage Konstantine TaxID=563121 RepID=B5U4V9_9CAUD|nr:membrane protein [Mycobacterium phage Konstantine]ACI12511.1 hypothetical protein KONSTANTINE_84 [Mycobacterium phage Konstantine]
MQAWAIVLVVVSVGPYLARRALGLPAGLRVRREHDTVLEQMRKREELRIREYNLRKFEACQECPKCRRMDFHWIKRGYVGNLYRECRNEKCGHVWRQVK